MYKVIQKGAEGEILRGQYEAALEAAQDAQNISTDEHVELEVVHEATGAVIAVTSPLSPGSFDPWTRVETPKFVAPHFADWRPAYTRKRVGAVVYRSLTSKSWMVLDTRTGGRMVVGTTKEAREITNSMRTTGFMIPAEEAADAVSA